MIAESYRSLPAVKVTRLFSSLVCLLWLSFEDKTPTSPGTGRIAHVVDYTRVELEFLVGYAERGHPDHHTLSGAISLAN